MVLLEVLRVGVYLGHWVVVLAGVIARRAVAEHREEECVLGESGAAGMRERERERERERGVEMASQSRARLHAQAAPLNQTGGYHTARISVAGWRGGQRAPYSGNMGGMPRRMVLMVRATASG